MMTRPHEVSTRLGKLGEVVNAVAPAVSQLLMTAAFSILPDSGKSRDGDGSEPKEKAPVSVEAYALSQLMRGIHL
jgi:hypothetical protein